MAAKFVLFTDKAKKFRFHLQAANGEIIAASEAYDTKPACLKGIESVKKNAPVAETKDETEVTEKKAPAKKPVEKKAE